MFALKKYKKKQMIAFGAFIIGVKVMSGRLESFFLEDLPLLLLLSMVNLPGIGIQALINSEELATAPAVHGQPSWDRDSSSHQQRRTCSRKPL